MYDYLYVLWGFLLFYMMCLCICSLIYYMIIVLIFLVMLLHKGFGISPIGGFMRCGFLFLFARVCVLCLYGDVIWGCSFCQLQ